MGFIDFLAHKSQCAKPFPRNAKQVRDIAQNPKFITYSRFFTIILNFIFIGFFALLKVVKDYADVADFVIIYIVEAHAMNRIPVLGNKMQIQHHKNIGRCFDSPLCNSNHITIRVSSMVFVGEGGLAEEML